MKMKVLRTNSAQSSVIDTEESRHNQRKDQLVLSLIEIFFQKLFFPIPIHTKTGSLLGRSPTSSNAAALIFCVSIPFFEAKSHLHFVFAFTQQR